MAKYILILFCSLVVICGCQPNDQPTEKKANAAAGDFNQKASDDKALAIADSVMQAMGGQQNWEQTKIISWNFFGKRSHTWNKKTGRDRIEIPDQNLVIDFNVHSKEGSVIKNGVEMTQPDSIQKYINRGYEMWVNDSYWLLMPFKLKDSGVTLKYMGLDTMQTGKPAHKLQLTFDSVGVTPQNKYYVYVDTTDHLVRQWAYFPKASMDEPQFVLPWKDYKKYGNILLSGDRGKYRISDIKVLDEWPEYE